MTGRSWGPLAVVAVALLASTSGWATLDGGGQATWGEDRVEDVNWDDVEPGAGDPIVLEEDSHREIWPNLVVVDVAVPEAIEVGEPVLFRAEVHNEGPSAARPSQTSFAVDGAKLFVVETPALPPGQATVVETDAWSAEPGPHELEVTADAGDVVREGDETDNTGTASFRVAGPNLVAGLEVRPEHPTTADGLWLDRSVVNEGSLAAGAFATETLRDGDAVEERSLDGLEAHTGLGWTSSLDPIEEPGTYELVFRVDADDEVEETSEGDNEARAVIEVTEPADPAVIGLDVEAQRIEVASTAGVQDPLAGHIVQVEVANLGDGAVRAPATLAIEACPEDPLLPVALLMDCERIVTRSLAAEEIEQGERVSERWDTKGKVGEWSVCADLVYTPTQEDAANDGRCEQTTVLVGGSPPTSGAS